MLVTNNVRDFNATDLLPNDHAGSVIVRDKNRSATAIASELCRIVAAYPGQDALTFESTDDWTTIEWSIDRSVTDDLPRFVVARLGDPVVLVARQRDIHGADVVV